MTGPQQDLIEALEALKALVALKQGPRDTHYRESKQPAWDRAAAIVGKIEAKQQALAQFERRSDSTFREPQADPPQCSAYFIADPDQRCTMYEGHPHSHNNPQWSWDRDGECGDEHSNGQRCELPRGHTDSHRSGLGPDSSVWLRRQP